ncbi:MAG TPA: ABC transporter ATP-binding protein [bacterium]|nr:ABC transporter ATP-binding protein [bacterium]HPN32453.1 ABC transporter ATP-binding protein [bacterium]
MLTVKNLDSYYGNLKVLSNISIHLNKGEIITILGANGAGKTSLLNSIMNIVKIKNGEILFNEKNILNSDTCDIVKSGATLVPEGRQSFQNLSVFDNLILGAYMRYGFRNSKIIKSDLSYIFNLFPVLESRQKEYAGSLSGGEQQMLAIGRALMSKPEVLLLDEPSIGLAPKITVQIFGIIKKLANDGISIVVVEQNANLALKFADRGYILENGRIILQGYSEDLAGNNEVRRAYLGSDKNKKWERR